MNRMLCAILCVICGGSVTGIGGCGSNTNSVEMPVNPEPAPGSPSAAGSNAPAIDTPNAGEPQGASGG